MANDKIIIKGANEHNLKNVSVTLPRDKLIVFTGLSGSGKSSLAFDTIYAEGQTVILITHNQELADEAQRVVRIADGLIQEMERGSHAV